MRTLTVFVLTLLTGCGSMGLEALAPPDNYQKAKQSQQGDGDGNGDAEDDADNDDAEDDAETTVSWS